jgi:F-type H+-transporting ATPase subunit delta
MSQALTFSRPYARAAFALAKSNQALPQWSSALSVSAQIAADPRVAAVIAHPRSSVNELVELVSPPSISDTRFVDFLRVLAENNRLNLLTEIAAQYEALRADAERIIKAKVTSAVPLDMVQVGELRSALKRRFNREVDIETAVDPSLIGGAVIDTGDVVIDGSVRSKIQALGTALAQ